MGRDLPLDYDEWRAEWDAWRAEHVADLRPSTFRFPPPNFLADEVLGVWRIKDRTVELSAVTFMDRRAIGITYGTGAGIESGTLAFSFEELELYLGIGGS